MKLKRTVAVSLIMANFLNTQSYAYEKINENAVEYVSISEKQLVNNIEIKWLNENITFYVGADILIEACVNNDASKKDIAWRVNELDNKSNVINLISNINNKAVIEAIDVGRAEIMALATDDSNFTREITVNVKNYYSDDANQSLISNSITPIQSRNISQNKKLLQVEADRSISNSEKIDSIDTYLRKLAKLGKLIGGKINSEHEDYEFYTINITERQDIEIEVRVDKKDESYSTIKDKLINVDKYNELNDEVIPPEKVPGDENKPGDESDNKIDKIIILGGDGTEDKPITIEVNKKLTSQEKIDTMHEYLQLLQESNDLEIINIEENDKCSAYKIKVSEKKLETKNDFYIEIIVDKEDEKSYKEIISMLNGINKSEKEDINDDELVEENDIDKEHSNNNKPNKEENLNDNGDVNPNLKDEESNINNKLNKGKKSGEKKYAANVNNKEDFSRSKIKDMKQENLYLDEINSSLKEESVSSNKYLLTTATGTVIGGLVIGRINKRRVK